MNTLTPSIESDQVGSPPSATPSSSLRAVASAWALSTTDRAVAVRCAEAAASDSSRATVACRVLTRSWAAASTFFSCWMATESSTARGLSCP